jgi:phage minor structural protein
MIIYFADRHMNILGMASTDLPEGLVISNDVKKEDIDSGVASFSCDLYYYTEDRLTLESYCAAGNYILRSHDDEHEFYTIIESETDVQSRSISIYAEDAGLDLLNEVAPAYSATEAKSAAFYVNMFIEDSGFEIGNNDLKNEDGSDITKQLEWTSESTVTARLLDIATQFDVADLSFSFEIDKLKVTHKYVNLYKKRGKDTGEQLRVGKEIENIVITRSVANLATALLPTGSTSNDTQTTLKGYSWSDDDDDFYVDSATGQLRSKKALAKWTRYNMETGTGDGGYIVKSFSYDTTDQTVLKDQALAELKSICDVEINYEIDVLSLPEGIKIGDTINVIDDAGELYVQSRLLSIETSVVNDTKKVTLGDHLIKSDGINSLVLSLADDFATRVIARIDIPTEAASRVNAMASNMLQYGIAITGPWKHADHQIKGDYPEGSVVESQGIYTVVADPTDMLGFKLTFDDASTAEEFSAAKTYNKGDVVLYQSKLYICTEDNTTGYWDATKWAENTRTIRVLATSTLTTSSIYWSIFDSANTFVEYQYLNNVDIVNNVLDQEIKINLAAGSVHIGLGSNIWSKEYSLGNIHFCDVSSNTYSQVSQIKYLIETTTATTNQLSENQKTISETINTVSQEQTNLKDSVQDTQDDVKELDVILNGGTSKTGETITGVVNDVSEVKTDLENYKKNVEHWIRFDSETGLEIGEVSSQIISRQTNQSYAFVDNVNNVKLLELTPDGAIMDQAIVDQVKMPKDGENWAIRAEANGNLSIVYLG